MNVIRFPRHKLFRCKPGCDGCSVCEGGLAICVVCDGAENDLPTDCPGERMTYHQKEHVEKQQLDYRFGHGWVRLSEGKAVEGA